MSTLPQETAKMAAAVISVLCNEARKGEKVLIELCAQLRKEGKDDAVLLALESHAKSLRLTADEAEKQVALLQK